MNLDCRLKANQRNLKMNSIFALLIALFAAFEMSKCAEIPCWSFWSTTWNRESLIRDSLQNVCNPRCAIVEDAFLFFTFSHYAFCPENVLDTVQNRQLLVSIFRPRLKASSLNEVFLQSQTLFFLHF